MEQFQANTRAHVRAHNWCSFSALVPVELEEGGYGLPEDDHDEGHEGKRNKLERSEYIKYTVCQRSLDLIYMITCYIKLGQTSWTYSFNA